MKMYTEKYYLIITSILLYIVEYLFVAIINTMTSKKGKLVLELQQINL